LEFCDFPSSDLQSHLIYGVYGYQSCKALSLLMMCINSNLNDSVALVRDKCSAEDLHWYRREVGKAMGAVHLDIEEKLWTEHPSLTALAVESKAYNFQDGTWNLNNSQSGWSMT
jgi:hypothetical protein